VNDIESLEQTIFGEIAAAADEAALDAVRVSALGKKGAVSKLLKSLGGMSPEERREKGPLFNGLRDRIGGAIVDRKTVLAREQLDARLAFERVDVTLPTRPEPRGSIHPVAQVQDEITAIFADLGFAVAEGPDVEFDDYNFTRLNIPADHPATGRRLTERAAHAYEPGAGAGDAQAEAADPGDRSGPRLPQGFRRDARTDVSSARGACDR